MSWCSKWQTISCHHALLERLSYCSGGHFSQPKDNLCRILDRDLGWVFTPPPPPLWVYTQNVTAYFIFTSKINSFLDNTCLLTGRGKTVSLGRCSDFGQSLRLMLPVRQARQSLSGINPFRNRKHYTNKNPY